MTSNDAPRIRERRLLHKGRKFDFEQVNLAHPDAVPIWREVVRHPGAVCILPILPPNPGENEPRIVMIRNHRFAISSENDSHLWEIPAGTKEPDEPADATARRELIEETGYETGMVRFLASFHTSPGMTDERMDAFVATDLREVGQQLEEDERIEVHIHSLSSVLAMIDSAQITDAKTILAILLALRRDIFGSSSWGPH